MGTRCQPAAQLVCQPPGPLRPRPVLDPLLAAVCTDVVFAQGRRETPAPCSPVPRSFCAGIHHLLCLVALIELAIYS